MGAVEGDGVGNRDEGFDYVRTDIRNIHTLHDPENNTTSDVWFKRFDDLLNFDLATLDDARRGRLPLQNLVLAFVHSVLQRDTATKAIGTALSTRL